MRAKASVGMESAIPTVWEWVRKGVKSKTHSEDLTTPGTWLLGPAATLLQEHPVNYLVNYLFQNSTMYMDGSFETVTTKFQNLP